MAQKKILLGCAVMMMGSVIFSTIGSTVTLMTQDKALKQMFPDVDTVITQTVTLSDTELAVVRKRLGGSLVHYQAGSVSESVAEKNTITFYIGIRNNKKVKVAVIDEQPGKWGPVLYIVALDTDRGTVNNLAVMAYQEKRGRPIALWNFLKQFVGKTSSDPINVRNEKGIRSDIRAISGATISSDATCFTVKKVIALYEEVFLKKAL
jgi:Na+-translocating ferredoxin:NAD+ oxidoreductase RnfG subunit